MGPAATDFFEDCHRRLDVLLQGALAFWCGVVDRDNGGFYGVVDQDGRPRPGADKDMVQQLRHLWTFSHLYRFENDSAEIKAICDHQFRFVIEHLYVSERREFHAATGPSGEPRPGPMQLYQLAFGMLGLAEYASAFPESETGRVAMQASRDVFEAVVDKTYHAGHGFDERVFPDRWCPHPKEINTQMHLLEAVAALFEAAQLHDDSAASDIESMLRHQLELIVDKGIVEREGRWFCSRGYGEDWSLIDWFEADHGHDIEVVFLAMEAAKILGCEDDPAIRRRLANLGREVTDRAYDPRHGKWFYSGNPLTGEVLQGVSNIWTNFEALNGLSVLHDLTGEAGYLEKFERLLHWLETAQYNESVGEWHYNVDDEGVPVTRDVFGSECGWMSFAWKSSYHSVRALATRKRWAGQKLLPG